MTDINTKESTNNDNNVLNNITIDTTTSSEVSNNRKEYRKGNNPTAVKVYTIVQESRYLIVSNVPTLGITKELIELFALYGPIEEYRFLDEHDNTTSYFDTYWIKFKNISQARIARRKLNKYVFYGSPLKVEYSPESETEDDIRLKMEDRIQSVFKRLESLAKQNLAPKKEEEDNMNKKKNKPNLMNFYNQPIPLMNHKDSITTNSNKNSNILSYNQRNHNTKRKIHLLPNDTNNNNNNNDNDNSNSSSNNNRKILKNNGLNHSSLPASKRQRRRI
ncbi:hypothetical protein BCR32DRAFT_296350 [Anaeromyces robustus]|uniref:RNA-binding protein 48 n=1 Tax=Anaeromyces robustus TaxID=1754192 RepID=A0A1Y1WSP1_9FUNG|nr:hypothetical protein BCR32DRAFT_296350 [Anaeromyces robustus]|eukprot:ORX76266.1 hypothetical protein BCR32DRAFT_296350 [Anaeromyces robustus]